MKQKLSSGIVSVMVIHFAASMVSFATPVTGDSANIGTGNTVGSGSKAAAVGEDNTASNKSLAVGEENEAISGSFAVGASNSASSYGGALGYNNHVGGPYSFAFGSSNEIDTSFPDTSMGVFSGGFGNWIESSNCSFGFGESNYLYKEYGSIVIGVSNGIYSNEWGVGSTYQGNGNFIAGTANTIEKLLGPVNNSFMLGVNNFSASSQSYIFGEGNNGQSGTVILGTYASNVTDASLIVGTGTGSGGTPRSNGLVVLKNGTVNIPSGQLQLGSESALTATSAAPVMSSYLTSNNYLKKATGSGASAASGATLAIGTSAYASNSSDIALGDYTIASGVESISIGKNAQSKAWSSIAIGGVVDTGAYQASAIGIGSRASGSTSIAIGYSARTNASAASGTAIGAGVISNGGFSTALGHASTSNGWDSTAIGAGSVSDGQASTALGAAVVSKTFCSIAIGSSNTGITGSVHNWIESDTVFELGNGSSSTSRSNAITTLKNGQTTLTNKAWKNRASTVSATEDPSTETTDSGGEALVVDGHTRLRGKVVIEEAQGDISMGDYQ